jgi:cytochrome c peroxidase
MMARGRTFALAGMGGLGAGLLVWSVGLAQAPSPEPPPKAPTYFQVVEEDFNTVHQRDVTAKPQIMQRQRSLLDLRYDLSNRPASGVMMSGGRKAVQEGVRVKLPAGVTWSQLATMPADEIRTRNLFPQGFLPLPHVKQETGGMIFPDFLIKEIDRQEARSLQRFDADHDLPDYLLPEFPPPLFLTTRPELGDVSKGQLLTIKNFFALLDGIVTPVQMEGMRLLLTPFPQQQFNQTDDRKVDPPTLGVACLDCHSNGHTNAAFHLNPDNRPEAARFRIDTVSLRGMFNQKIHGSKRSLRSVEDFTQFEQRTAYFDGDPVTATKKGANFPDRISQVAQMGQMQDMFDFPPAPKLTLLGRLDPAKATEEERLGEEVFFGKGQCGACHPAPFYLDDKMHDLKVERFYTPRTINAEWIHAEGPIKTFTLRGIKDSPPYLHDGRLLTLEDTVEFFNLVLGTQLTDREKAALVAFMRQL